MPPSEPLGSAGKREKETKRKGGGGLQVSALRGSLEKNSLGRRRREPLGEQEGESPGESEAPGRATHC